MFIHRSVRRSCPKRIRATLLPHIWPVYRARNRPKRSFSAARRATLRARPSLFGQFLEEAFSEAQLTRGDVRASAASLPVKRWKPSHATDTDSAMAVKGSGRTKITAPTSEEHGCPARVDPSLCAAMLNSSHPAANLMSVRKNKSTNGGCETCAAARRTYLMSLSKRHVFEARTSLYRRSRE